MQLRNEPPYHIVTPAMHLTRRQIADLFRDKLGENVEDADPVSLVAAARVALRRAFFSAEMGISGANFLVADSGMVAVSTNEGNGRLTTSIPRIHVVVTGIEKIIPRMSDLAALWPVLATSGTGQPITTYSTLIRGARIAGEPDGPQEFHVVLVDNGRTELLAEPGDRRGAEVHPMRRVPEHLSHLPAGRRTHVRNDLSRPHRQHLHAAHGLAQRVGTSLLRVFAVHGLQGSVPSQDRSAEAIAAHAPRLHCDRQCKACRTSGLCRLPLGDGRRGTFPFDGLDGPQSDYGCECAWALRNGARSYACVDKIS